MRDVQQRSPTGLEQYTDVNVWFKPWFGSYSFHSPEQRKKKNPNA